MLQAQKNPTYFRFAIKLFWASELLLAYPKLVGTPCSSWMGFRTSVCHYVSLLLYLLRKQVMTLLLSFYNFYESKPLCILDMYVVDVIVIVYNVFFSCSSSNVHKSCKNKLTNIDEDFLKHLFIEVEIAHQVLDLSSNQLLKFAKSPFIPTGVDTTTITAQWFYAV